MIRNIKLNKLLKIFLTILICFSASFFNYLVTQTIGGYFFPLTSLAIFYCFIFNFQIPVVLIFIVGLTDDLLLNSILGTYALLYSMIAYVLNLDFTPKQRKVLNIFAITIFLFINYITFRST